jgi:hypothetical protein
MRSTEARGGTRCMSRSRSHGWRRAGSPCRTSTPWGPLGSYTRSGGSPPESTISRMGTRMPRGPSRYAFREPGKACSKVSLARLVVGADMASSIAGATKEGGTGNSLRPPPSAGVNRIRFQGTVSTPQNTAGYPWRSGRRWVAAARPATARCRAHGRRRRVSGCQAATWPGPDPVRGQRIPRGHLLARLMHRKYGRPSPGQPDVGSTGTHSRDTRRCSRRVRAPQHSTCAGAHLHRPEPERGTQGLT